MLNTQQFTLLAGNPESWDAELRSTPNLVACQEDQHRRGRRSAILIPTLNGWSVRLASGLDNPQVLLKGATFEDARTFGQNWANQNPADREFYIRNSDLGKAQVGQ